MVRREPASWTFFLVGPSILARNTGHHRRQHRESIRRHTGLQNGHWCKSTQLDSGTIQLEGDQNVKLNSTIKFFFGSPVIPIGKGLSIVGTATL